MYINSTPSTLAYAQMLSLLAQIKIEIGQKRTLNLDDISARIRQAMTDFQLEVGSPLMDYSPIHFGEPPFSAQMNKTWGDMENDLRIIQREMDFLNAALIVEHNVLRTEIEKERYENMALANKIKTLQVYSDSISDNVMRFADYFTSSEFIDNSFLDPAVRASLNNGYVTLREIGEAVNLKPKDVTILEESNGFVGNNQEVTVTTTAPNPDSNQSNVVRINNQKIEFKSGALKANDLTALIDRQPNTWIEYEYYHVADQDRQKAQNFGFLYDMKLNAQIKSNYSQYGAGSTALPSGMPTSATAGTIVDWASGPKNGVLKLGLAYDLGSVEMVNNIQYIPYGLEQDKNFPVLIRRLEVSNDGTEWEPIFPEEVWVGTAMNLLSARTASDVLIGNANWVFPEKAIRYVRIHIEQPNPVQALIGHIYSAKVNQKGEIVRVSNAPFNFETLETEYAKTSTSIPNVTASSSQQASVFSLREVFSGRRWAIGIRDLNINKTQYADASALVSTRIRVGRPIERVSIEADVVIPQEYDANFDFVRFFISPDDGEHWYRISRIEDVNSLIPEMLSFNDSIPKEFRKENIGYITTAQEVTDIRVKIELYRQSTTGSTPMVRNYRVKMITK